jgi:hypothetical protein
MDDDELLARRFEEHRPHLRAVATRMLGSRAEADDALQEAWLRINRADTSDVDNIGGRPTTVVPRVCALRIIEGARAVASRARFFSTRRVAHPVIVDGAAGFVATEAGVPVAVLAFTVVDGRITAIDALSGPARLGGLDLEALVAR